jgi:outer membrane protein assembly factor BamE (lipoprotein component of BamABCDE complex)
MLFGCAAAGVQVSDQQAASFKVGKSTYGDVVAALGPPTSTITSSNGKRSAVYSYAAVQARPQNYIPYIGPFISAYDTKASAVTFEFDARGVLTSTSSTQGAAGIGANLAAGSVQPAPITAQPR